MRKPFFENNRVALYCGDSLEVLDELAAEGKRFDLFLTDPPYGLNQANKKPSGINAERAKGAYEGNLFVDDENYLHNVVRKVLEKSLKMCDLGILTGGVGCWKYAPPPQEEGCMYMPSSPGFNTWAHSDYQPIWYYGKPKGNIGKYRILSHTVTERGYSKGHPCSKPLQFWEKLMLCGTDGVENKEVLDPFAGSGTTGQAAMNLNMRATLIELNPKYCELIARNLAQETLF